MDGLASGGGSFAAPQPVTLYINNIEEKINKTVLKQLLYMLFSQYGRIEDVVACKGKRLRGQAWVVFRDTASATNALRGKQGFCFYGKDLRIQFSNNVSRVVSDRERINGSKNGGGSIKSSSNSKRARENNSDNNNDISGDGSSDGARKRVDIERIYASLVPNKTLSANSLPVSFTSDMLQLLFQNSAGFMGVRMPRAGAGLIDFVDETHASIAFRQLHGFKYSATEALQLAYSTS